MWGVFVYRVGFVVAGFAVAVFRHVATARAKPPDFSVFTDGAVVHLVAIGAAALWAGSFLHKKSLQIIALVALWRCYK